MTQQSFWGMDDQGNNKNSGHRIVYVFEDAVRKKLKIGFTTRDGMKRMKAQQTGNPDRLEFVGSFVVRDDQDDRDYHKMFARFHYCGGGGDEWFDDVPELRAALMRLIRNPVVFRIPQNEIFSPGLRSFQLQCPSCRELIWFAWDIRNTDELEQAKSLIGKTMNATCRSCGRPCHFEIEQEAA